MSYKVVKNAQGVVVGFGPNDSNYEPAIPAGGRLEISPTPPPPAPAEIAAVITGAVQHRLDSFALERAYDNVGSMSKYANLTDLEIVTLPLADQGAVTQFRKECRYALLKVAQTWAVAERIQAQVVAGTRPMPASIADIEAELPALVWPA